MLLIVFGACRTISYHVVRNPKKYIKLKVFVSQVNNKGRASQKTVLQAINLLVQSATCRQIETETSPERSCLHRWPYEPSRFDVRLDAFNSSTFFPLSSRPRIRDSRAATRLISALTCGAATGVADSRVPWASFSAGNA